MSEPASANFPWSSVPEPPSGTKDDGYLRWRVPGLTTFDLPYLAVRGSSPGTSITIMAGVGPNYYPITHGLLRLIGALEPTRLAGSLMILPQVMIPGIRERVPGQAHGEGLEVAAQQLAREILAPAGGLIDLQSPALNEITADHSVMFVSNIEDIDQRSVAMAEATGFRYALAKPMPARPSGVVAWMTSIGKPSIGMSASDHVDDRERATEAVFNGLINVLREVGLFGGRQTESPVQKVEPVGDARAPIEGLWTPAVRVGQRIRVNDRLGSFQDAFGNELGDLIANEAGMVLSYSTAVTVSPEQRLVKLVQPRK